MRIAIVLAVIAATSIAHAEPRKPTTLLEVRWHAAWGKVTTKIFSTGMWTRQAIAYDGSPTSTGGRFDGATFDEFKLGLKNARWKVTKAQAHCQASSDDVVTEYYVDSHKRYTASSCNDTVDDKTAKLIELVGKAIALTVPEIDNEEIDEVEPTP